MLSILFVCTGNTCRSVIAEALAKRRFGDSVRVQSAGIRPQSPEDAANAIKTLKTHFDMDASGHIPRDVRSLKLEDFDYVVALDNHVAQQLKASPISKLLIWRIDDPYGDDPDQYLRCARKINQEVVHLPIPGPSVEPKNCV